MNYNFDSVIERRGTGCVKYDVPEAEGRIPLWVADMDFATPPFIMEALRKRLDHAVLGYPVLPDDYFQVISGWVKNLHDWDVSPAFIKYVPGIVKGIGMALNCLLSRGDKVVIQPPVYHPFRLVPQNNGFEVVFNPLLPVEKNGVLTGYRMNLDGLESILESSRDVKALILSNPHNPAGICWTREELIRLAEICCRHGVTVISDEIHCEMLLGGRKHIPFASVSPLAARCSITFMAPSKTFNIAGLVSSYVIVLDDDLRKRFFGYLEANEYDYVPVLPAIATMAAYKEGAQWRVELLSYIEGNLDYLENFIAEHIPCVRVLRPQASFLAWLDFRKLSLNQTELVDLIENKAGLLLNDGTMFGPGGEGYMRLNVGCPRSTLASALERLASAISD